ncbi:hypothetical protein, partial [Burkholderia gladioli]|uniref:hypothetical protein n=1 Tax=Burkholderia gladioli TaxID=28095 RepID=UPI001ABB39AF
AELLQQLGGNRRQLGRHGFRFARHMFSLGQKYASNTKLRTGPSSGTLGTYISVAPLFSLPLFWTTFIASILLSIAIAICRQSAIAEWISRSKFSKDNHYQSLDDEIKAFHFSIEG